MSTSDHGKALRDGASKLPLLSPDEAHTALDAFFAKLATEPENYEAKLFIVSDGVKHRRFVIQMAAMALDEDGNLSALKFTQSRASPSAP